MNAKLAVRRKAISETKIELRGKLWPDIKESDLWSRKRGPGFTTIPRTLPLFMEIMDSMSNAAPVSKVYLDLWCRSFDENVVSLNNKDEMAFYCGFGGQRGVQTWTKRIKILESLGFIRTATGANGQISYALILNPYNVVQTHRGKKTPGLTDRHYNALVIRANEIKADDI